MTAAGAMLALVPLAAASAACPRAEPAASQSLVREINAVRASAGLPALRVRRAIVSPARTHSAAMARSGRLWHDNLTGWAGSARAAQNVAAGDTGTRTLGAMLGSPPHRRALMDRRFREVGVGAVRGCDGTLMVTVNVMVPSAR